MNKADELFDLCKKFIDEQDIYSAETVHQSDEIILNALDFIEKICDIVGYVDRE